MKRFILPLCLLIVLFASLTFFWSADQPRRTLSPPAKEIPRDGSVTAPQNAKPTPGAIPAVDHQMEVAPAAIPLFAEPRKFSGARLDPKGARYIQALLDGQPVGGRSAELDRQSFGALGSVREGDSVRIPLIGGEAVEGIVHFATTDSNGWIRVAGELMVARTGTFSFATKADRVVGLVQLPAEEIAYEIAAPREGQLVLRERLLSEIICTPMPRPVGEKRSAARAPLPQSAPPILSSRPEATNVLYLDFDGETVRDDYWNGGQTIQAAPAALSNPGITEVWNRVKEDFLAFNVDVTTDVARYNGAPVGRRMRCIVTPTDYFRPDAGGVAYLNSFSGGGQGGFSSTIPCWAFIDNDAKFCAEVISHELGHTLGLSHDGRVTPSEEYYGGHGDGETGWAPIMGVGYYKQLVQWSKGEYPNANRQQDDIAIMAGELRFIADEAGNSIESAVPIETNNGEIVQRGIINQASDSDFYIFNTTGGVVTILAEEALQGANVDISLEVKDVSGVTVATANPEATLRASLNFTLTAGTYYLGVRGSGKGAINGNGYSAYGCSGAYRLSGTAPGLSRSPILTSGSRADGTINEPFSFQIAASNSPTFYTVSGALPSGVAVDSATGLISGTPTVSGRFDVTVIARNEFGDGSKRLAIVISPGIITLLNALDAPGLTWSSVVPRWSGQALVTQDGVDAAQSGDVLDSQESRLQTTVVGPATLSFRWKVSSQQGSDFLSFSIDDVNQAAISGELDWQVRTFSIPSGSHVLRWTYRKDLQVAEGQDRGWVDTVAVGPLNKPVITSATRTAGQLGVLFTYQINAENTPTSFSNTGALPPGLSLNPTSGLISGTPTTAGTFDLVIHAQSGSGRGSQPLRISVAPAVIALGDAVDLGSLTWTTGGDAPWSGQILTTFDGADAAQSGDVGDLQESWIETTAEGPATVVFSWKVDSEAGFDFLYLFVDGSESAAISGDTDWQVNRVPIPVGTHTLRWIYRKEAAASFGADAGWLDNVIITTAQVPVVSNSGNAGGRVGSGFSYQINASNNPTSFGLGGNIPPGISINPSTGLITGVPTEAGTFEIILTASNDAGTAASAISLIVAPPLLNLAQALDSVTSSWTTGGDAAWFAETVITQDGVDAAQSAPLQDSEESWVETQVTGPTVLSFRWKVSSEPNFDFLAVLIDGVVQATISGTTNWEQRNFSLPSGSHAVRWRYQKDGSTKAGNDAGWLDRVSFSPTTAPGIIGKGTASATIGEAFSYQIAATNAPTSFSAVGLPPGLILNTDNGLITGSAETIGRFEVTITATNANGSGNALLVITASKPVPVITSASTASGQVGNVFAYQIAATLNPMSFGATGLPGELTLDSGTGLISGTPAAKGTFIVFLSATNSDGTGTRTLALSIGATVPALAVEGNAEGQVGLPFSMQLSATSDPLGFSVRGLPPGLVIDGATGSISGSPASAGVFDLLATVNNRNGAGTLSFQILIAETPVFASRGSDSSTAPTPLRGPTVALSDNNSDATAEEGELAHAGIPAAKSLWWMWTAPHAGPVAVSTTGSTFDTVLAIYRQDGVGGLSLVASNDNAIGSVQSSEVRFSASPGDVFLIAVDGVGGTTGDLNLTIRYTVTSGYAGILKIVGKPELPAGYLTLTLTADWALTGKVMLGRSKASFRGQLDASGKAVVPLRIGGQPLTLNLALEGANGAGTLSGGLLVGGETFVVVAQRSKFSKTHPANAIGAYTMILEPDGSAGGQPLGTGFATARVETSGKVTLSGQLGDGSPFSHSTVLSDNDTFPFYAAPYRAGGTLTGIVSVGALPRRALSSSLDWRKLPDSSRRASYRTGFTAQTRLVGGAYVLAAPVLNFGGEGVLRFVAGNLAVPVPLPLVISSENKATAPGGGSLPVKFDAKRGLFSGSFTGPIGRQTFKGALLQGEQRGAGLFSANGATGTVQLAPKPAP